MAGILFSDDIDDRLMIAYLEDDFNNVWHGSWESLIESYYSMMKTDGFRKQLFEDFKDWYTSFRRTPHFKKLLENEKVRATIKDIADYEDPRKAAYNAAYYPRIAYNGATAFERLIANLYNKQCL
jgi:hypothetical protein